MITGTMAPPGPHFLPRSREQAQDGARLSHQMDEPSLDFECTKPFAQSAIHKVIPLLRKILCTSKSRRDHLAPW